jgi:hypothetical protein
MKYNLAIINVSKALTILLSIISWAPVAFTVIYQLDSNFMKEQTIIALTIILVPPISFLILWLMFQKNGDVFTVTENGIESKNHGKISWNEISICSWESFRGSISINLLLKNKKSLSISPTSTWKNYSKSYDDLKCFIEEIKNTRNKLPEKESLKIVEGRISNKFNLGLVIFIIILLIGMVIFNFIKN